MSFTASASGEAATVGKGRARFARQSSFLIVTDGGELERVSEMTQARELISRLNEAGRWQPGWFLVTAVRRYDACTVVIAQTSGVTVELEVDATAGLTPSAVRAGFSVGADATHASTWTMDAATTPLFEALYRHTTWLRTRRSVRTAEQITRDENSLSHGEDTPMEMEMETVVREASPSAFGLVSTDGASDRSQ